MANLSRLRSVFNQSPWLDNVSQGLINDGTLRKLIDSGVGGVTSNPTIFEHSIGQSDQYTEKIKQLLGGGASPEEIYWNLTTNDIKDAAKLLLPFYESSSRSDGFVSIEVSPNLAHDSVGTVAQAKKLWNDISMPNLMIKVPATAEGLPAIATLIADGINVNVTLIFGLRRYLQVISAYLNGLEQCKTKLPSSVASFFVSRVDTMLDPMLEQIGSAEAKSLQGKLAIAQARAAYGMFLEAFSPESERWRNLKDKGASLQRPLWASTSTKNPHYDDLLYVSNLVANDTVNTMPDQTIAAVEDHLPEHLKPIDFAQITESHEQLNLAAKIGIDMNQISQKLEDEGVTKFIESFSSVLKTIESKR